MERVQSLTVPVPGGAGRSEGGGWKSIRRGFAIAAWAAVAAGGVGCVTASKVTNSCKAALGIGSAAPATQLTAAFQPQIQYLPDPTQDTTRRPGLVGQMFLIAADGQYTDVDGDLTVMAEDITLRPPGMPKAISEVWHFDKATLRRLKTKDERFGDTYALFLPYPPNWKDVTQISISCKYEPKPEPGTPAGPVLNNSPQVLTLDFSTPGKPVWTEVANGGGKPTAPAEVKGIPDLGKAIAQGRVGASMNGPQPGLNPAAQHAVATTPQLPQPVQFDANRPVDVKVGPNGSQVQTTAFALPPGQTMPPGWTVGPNRELVPPPGTNPWTVTPLPQSTVQPPTHQYGGMPVQGYPPAAAATPPPNAPNYPVAPQASGFSAPPVSPSYPAAHQTFAPPSGGYQLPADPLPPPYPVTGVPQPASAPLPAIPPMTGGPTGFDPNSPTGPWANGAGATGATEPSLPPIPMSANPNTVTIPRR